MSHGGKDFLCSSMSHFDMYEIKAGNLVKGTNNFYVSGPWRLAQ